MNLPVEETSDASNVWTPGAGPVVDTNGEESLFLELGQAIMPRMF